MVDLGELQPIAEIVVFDRLDADPAAPRSAHLIVAVSDDSAVWRAARYVRLSLPERTGLHLDEVEVY